MAPSERQSETAEVRLPTKPGWRYYRSVEWDFLKVLALVLLAAFAMWAAWGSPISAIKKLLDLWRG